MLLKPEMLTFFLRRLFFLFLSLSLSLSHTHPPTQGHQPSDTRTTEACLAQDGKLLPRLEPSRAL